MQLITVCENLMEKVHQTGVNNSALGDADLIRDQMLPELEEDLTDFLDDDDAFLDDRNRSNVYFNTKEEVDRIQQSNYTDDT